MDPASELYVPKAKRPLLVREARIMAVLYGALAVMAVAWGYGGLVLVCWLLPRVVGEPIQRIIRVAEHVGCTENSDLMTNTRTTLSNPLVNAIAWQMPYHAEHHLFPNVPFHNLSAVHKQVADKIVVEAGGYIAGQKAIIANLRKIITEGDGVSPKAML